MALQFEKTIRQLPAAGAGDLDDTGSGIVIANPRGDPSHKPERTDMSVLEGFRTFAGIGHDEQGIGIG
jgi:hypothetical protein